MKGIAIITILVTFFLAIAVLGFSLTVLGSTKESFKERAIPEILAFQNIRYNYEFNINDLIVDSAESAQIETSWSDYFGEEIATIEYAQGENFCEDLKRCIIYGIEEGKPCYVSTKTKINSYDITNFNELMNSCYNEPIHISENGIDRTVCNFNKNSITSFNVEPSEDSGPFNARDADGRYIYLPEIHDCYFNRITTEYKNPLEEWNNLYFYNPPFYTSKLSSEGIGANARIYVTDVKSNDRRGCEYNLFVCSQNAIAESEDDWTIQIFEKMRSINANDLSPHIEIYQDCYDTYCDSSYKLIEPPEETYRINLPNIIYLEEEKQRKILYAMYAGFSQWTLKNGYNFEIPIDLVNSEITSMDQTGIDTYYLESFTQKYFTFDPMQLLITSNNPFDTIDIILRIGKNKYITPHNVPYTELVPHATVRTYDR